MHTCMKTHAQCEVQLAQLREAVHQKNQQIMELQRQHEDDANRIQALYKEVCLRVLACKCMCAGVNLRVCQGNRWAGCCKMFHQSRVSAFACASRQGWSRALASLAGLQKRFHSRYSCMHTHTRSHTRVPKHSWTEGRGRWSIRSACKVS
jgi:hypothetical protein